MHHMTANWSPNAQEERAPALLRRLGAAGLDRRLAPDRQHVGARRAGTGSPTRSRSRASAGAPRTRGSSAGGPRRPSSAGVASTASWSPPRGPGASSSCAPTACGARSTPTSWCGSPRAPRPTCSSGPATRRLHGTHGWELAGAFRTAMVNDDEALLLWAIPTWRQWADAEQATTTSSPPGAAAARGDQLAPHPARRRPPVSLPHRPPAGPLRPHRLGGVTFWRRAERYYVLPAARTNPTRVNGSSKATPGGGSRRSGARRPAARGW